MADDATAASWNPGGLIQLETPEVSAVVSWDHRKEDRDLTGTPGAGGSETLDLFDLNYLSAAYPFTLFNRNMIVSLNYQTLYDFNREADAGFLYLTDYPGPVGDRSTRRETDGCLKALSPAFSIQATPTLSFGATINWFSEDLGSEWETVYRDRLVGSFGDSPYRHDIRYKEENSFDGINFNLGMLWNITPNLTLGAVYKAPFHADSRFGPKDEDAPVIELKDWPEGKTVYLDKIYVSGRAMDSNAVLKLLVNNRPILRKEGQSVFFNHLAALKEGENTIAVEARDAAGNVTRETATVVRQVPEALQLEERLRVSVFPFQRKGEVSPWSLAYQNQLVEALMDRNRFKLIERNRLDLILKEQKLSMTGLVDRATAIRMGKLLAAQCVLVGDIIETHTGIEIVGRMIDVETAEILSSKDVYDEVKDFEATHVLADGMAIKFHQDFPLVSGIVLLKKGNQIFTDLGADKIALKHRLLVYREEPVFHPISGKKMGADAVIIGNAVVNLVDADMSKAELVGEASGDIEKLDRVITQ